MSDTTTKRPTQTTGQTQLVGDKLLTIPEVAEMLRSTDATLRYWRHIGTGPRSFRVGRHVRYRLSDVLDWVEEQCRNAQAAPRNPGHAR